MEKFWTFCVVLFLVGTGAVIASNIDTTENIEFTDLETECRISEESEVTIRLQDDKISFDGHFPERDTDADLSYGYTQDSNSIVLNVKSRAQSQEIDYFTDCLASVVYEAETSRLEPGVYDVTVKHNGEEAAETSLRVN